MSRCIPFWGFCRYELQVSSGWPKAAFCPAVGSGLRQSFAEAGIWASIPDRAPVRSFSLSSLPRTQMKRAASRPCLALLPAGVTWPPALLRTPVVSYTTFSPSPLHKAKAVCFCGPIRQVAPSRGFPGAVPCGVRTFLDPAAYARNRDRPASLKTRYHTVYEAGESISGENFYSANLH